MVPSIMNLKIESRRLRLRLWLPLFILWPLALVLFLFLLPFLVIAEIILRLTKVKIYLFAMLGGLFSLISATRGLTIKVNSRKQDAIVNVTVH